MEPIPVGMGYANENVHDRNLVRFGIRYLHLPTLVDNPDYDPAITSPFNLKSVPITASPGNRRNSGRTKQMTRDYTYALCNLLLIPFIFQYWADRNRELRPVSKCVNIPTQDYQGWSFKKYQTLDANLGEINYADGANYYLLRMADVYLLYAEACMNSGEGGTGPGIY